MEIPGFLGTEDAHPLKNVTSRNQRFSPLLRLPAELRIRIYELALPATLVVKIDPMLHRFYVPPMTHRSPWRSTLSLLGACRQIAHEAMPIAYAVCRFYGDLAARPGRIGSAQCRLIQSMTVDDGIFLLIRRSVQRIAKGTTSLQSLRRMTIRCGYSYTLVNFDKKVNLLRRHYNRENLEVMFEGPAGEELYRST